MYHVIGTGLTSILLYLISYLFFRIGYYSLQFHRKLWNSILAVAFLSTALAGLFMALQINYKWDLPLVKTVLKWHVEAGIGMTFTGIFHFLWHFSYYGKIFSKQDNLLEKSWSAERSSKEISLNLFMIGLISSSVQLLLVREIMNIAGGYELITGIFLASWLILSAIGVSISGKSALSDIKKINLIFSVSPMISLILLFLISRLFLNSGETPSLLVSLIYTFLILIPFCIVSGFTFIKLISIARSGNEFVPGKSFSIETAGGVAAGILIPLLTSGILNTYQLLLLLMLLSLSYVLLSFYLKSPRTKLLAKIFVAGLASSVIIFHPDIFFRQILLPGIKVTSSKDTPYGNVTYGLYKNERSIYYNHRLLAYNNDVIEREENIHYAMLQSISPKKVILVSGFFNSCLPELLKYPVRKIIYVERDPALAALGTYGEKNSQYEISVSNDDAYKYFRRNKELVDVVILLVPPPSTLQLNRYYTTDFFYEVKNKLDSGGVFICSPGPGDTYFNKESLKLYSSVYNSLAAVFKNVRPVAGNKLYFIASDKELSLAFCRLSEEKNIKNTYVSPDYLNDALVLKKSEEISSLMDHKIQQNRSAFPVGSFHLQSYNFSKNIDEKVPAILLMIAVFAIPAVKIKRRNILMYFCASALAGFEIIILLTLQLVAGNMYQLTGLIIAGLMTGLAVGAGSDAFLLNSMSISMKSIYLLFFYICIGLIYNSIISLSGEFLTICLIILSSFLPALLTGSIFRELTKGHEGSAATDSIYSADLAGSAFGFIFISLIAVPILGIRYSVFLLSLMVFTGFLFGTVRNK